MKRIFERNSFFKHWITHHKWIALLTYNRIIVFFSTVIFTNSGINFFFLLNHLKIVAHAPPLACHPFLSTSSYKYKTDSDWLACRIFWLSFCENEKKKTKGTHIDCDWVPGILNSLTILFYLIFPVIQEWSCPYYASFTYKETEAENHFLKQTKTTSSPSVKFNEYRFHRPYLLKSAYVWVLPLLFNSECNYPL